MSIPAIPDVLPPESPADGRRRVRRAARPRGLPHPAPEGARQAAGLPRQRRHHAEAAGVLDALQRYYSADNANIHRGVHLLSERATRDYEERPRKVAALPQRRRRRARSSSSAAPPRAINLVAQTFGRKNVRRRRRGPHHRRWSTTPTSSPGRCCARRTGPSLRVVPINDDGELLLDEFEKLLTPRTRMVAVVHVSNALGTINPVKRIIELAHARGVPVLIDGAQAVLAPAGRRARAGLRLLRVLRPQDVRADRHRRALRQGGAAGGDAALPGRRRHDPLGDASRRPPTTSCPTSSRRARRTSPAPSASGRRSTTSQGSDWEAIAAHEARAAGARDRAPVGRFPGLRLIGTAARQGGRGLVRRGRAAVVRARRRARSSTWKASPSAPATTAASR